ncbi:MAG: PD-(D/E)XK nuclease family protein [Candidatus Aenigmarchaeota archaeon]|nr:PD-(D/E)XK nuclease family protein [Candidatus Aenigmarchaeota archaeon]
MPYKLSPSSLSLLKECPRCFWLQFNKKIHRPNGVFPSLPSGMDRIFKTHFDSFRDKGLLPPELEKLDGSTKLFGDKQVLDIWRNNLKGIQWTDDEGNIFRGAVDNILQKGKKLIVLDYKTRGYELKEDTHEHYQDQLDIYNLLLRKNGYDTEDYAYLLFYYPNKINENGDVLFHNKLLKMKISIKNAERIFKEAINILKGDMPEINDDCVFCEWIEVNNI